MNRITSNGNGASTNGKASKAKPVPPVDPFPVALFQSLLKRFVLENFDMKVIEEGNAIAVAVSNDDGDYTVNALAWSLADELQPEHRSESFPVVYKAE